MCSSGIAPLFLVPIVVKPCGDSDQCGAHKCQSVVAGHYTHRAVTADCMYVGYKGKMQVSNTCILYKYL